MHVLPLPDAYRGQHLDGGASARGALAEARAAGGEVAAFIAESVLSCGGQVRRRAAPHPEPRLAPAKRRRRGHLHYSPKQGRQRVDSSAQNRSRRGKTPNASPASFQKRRPVCPARRPSSRRATCPPSTPKCAPRARCASPTRSSAASAGWGACSGGLSWQGCGRTPSSSASRSVGVNRRAPAPGFDTRARQRRTRSAASARVLKEVCLARAARSATQRAPALTGS